MTPVRSTDLSNRLTALRASTSAMVADFDEQRWTDADMAAPIALPRWTRGHVLTHIARNADSIARALSGALRGEIVQRYPDGPEGRAADIEAGAGRPVLEQLADVRESADRLDRMFGGGRRCGCLGGDGGHAAVRQVDPGEMAGGRGPPGRRRLRVHGEAMAGRLRRAARAPAG